MRILALALIAALVSVPMATQGQSHDGPVNFVRYSHDGQTSYGVLQGDRIMQIDGDLFGEHRATDRWLDLSAVKLLPPTDPEKVIAVGLNYQSHLGTRAPAEYPGLFAKYPTSLVGQGDDIVAPPDAANLHYEGEMVLVIGKRCSNVSEADALDCVFGITAGNDVSERDWQAADLQWFRAKGSDTFGPVGPTIAANIDPDDVLVETRVNGEIRQSERTSDLLFGTATIVSYISRYVTLEPGDLIFTGTPGSTQAMQPGDVVEIEVEGVGVLRNTVRQTIEGDSAMKRSAGALVGLLFLGGAAVFLWNSGEPQRPPEPVRFATVAEPAFDAGGTLADAWADFDGDGDPDRFVGFNGTPSRLYRNDGTAGFTDVAEEVGLSVERSVRTAAWGDYDADGDPDLLLGYAGDAPVTALFRNDEGTFAEIAAEAGLQLSEGTTRQASWVDYDGDGDLDLFLALRDRENQLFANENGAFSNIGEEVGIGDARRSVGAVWFDAEGDGDLDVYVANMNGDANGMWLQGPDGFIDAAEQLGLADGGRALENEEEGTVRPCAVDFDNDGDLDLFTTNYGPNGLLQNPGGDGPWSNVAAEEGLAETSRYDTCAWGDFDHDGSLDLYVNGTVTGGRQYRDWLYRREGGPFLNVTPDALDVAADHGATWVDYDLDGDLDLALAGVADDGMHHLVQNLLRPEYARHHLKVRVVDGRGAAILAGATVHVYAAGTERLLGTGLVDSGSGYDSQSDLPVHFGLTTGEPVDVEVSTPGPGRPIVTRVDDVDPEAHRGRSLEVRVGG